ncbi:hypothetical protein D3C78_815910 [compost metagenome]
MGVHALAGLGRQPVRRGRGERAEPRRGGHVPRCDQRAAAPGPPRQGRSAERDAHAEGRQQQHRTFVSAPQVGHLQVRGQSETAVEPGVTQLEMIGEQMKCQRQTGSVQRAESNRPGQWAQTRANRPEENHGGNGPEEAVTHLRQEP